MSGAALRLARLCRLLPAGGGRRQRRIVLHGFRPSDPTPARGGDGSAGFVLQGDENSEESGITVDAGGDINGDGIGDAIVSTPHGYAGGLYDSGQTGDAIDDVLIAAPYAGVAGETYVVFGRRLDNPDCDTTLPLD
jgi:hypothetical protein